VTSAAPHPPDRLPAVFLGHGDPRNALADNRWTRAWRELGASLPTPRAVVVVSAHWYVGSTLVTAMERPRTIHDFWGFPAELEAVEYPAPGSPSVAEEVADAVHPTWVGLDRDGWGLDHGAWSVLAHLLPRADVPVVQLSVNVNEGFDAHVELGRRLAPLRDRGVLLVGSGNVVHNLGMLDWRAGDAGTDWAVGFDDACRSAMTGDPASVAALVDHPAYRLAVPTPDHWLPLAPVVGVALASGSTATAVTDGFVAGSLSMTSYRVD
jgi:4,5-DOPA dioxygenase extradiol